MDPITHAIAGAAISYAIGGCKLGRHAAGLGALAGIAPDVDHFISSKSDPLLYVEFHRYFTHSIAFSFLGAFVPILPWLLRQKFRSQLWSLWVCAWPAYLSHCLLDACTTWGTQLYWPFARTRVSWDIIAIIDPLFTLVLAAMLVAFLIRKSRRVALFALVFAFTYLGFGIVQHTRAARVQRQLAATRKHTMQRSEVMPSLANNVVWRSVYLTNGKIYSDRIRVGWFSRGAVREGSALPLLATNELRTTERIGNRIHHGFDRFQWFTGGWVARSPADETVIGDMRYSRSTEAFDPVWGIRFTNIQDRAAIEWVSRERDRRLNLQQLWAEISGSDQRFKKLPR